MNFFYVIDLFKLPVSLQIGNRDKNSTVFGQLISVLIIGYLTYSFFRGELFERKNPNVIEQNYVGNIRPKLSLNSTNFALSLAVTDVSSKAIIDPTIFSINLYYEELISQKNETGKQISHLDIKSLHPCNESDYPNDPSAFSDLGLTNYMCMDNSTLELEGYWDEPKLSYFFVVLQTCENGTIPNVTCKSQEEIQEALRDKYFQIYYKDINYDMNDYENPIKWLFKTEFLMIDFFLRKKMTLSFKKTEILDEKGYFLDDTQLMQFFKKDETTLDVDFKNKMDSRILGIMFYPSLEIIKVSRKFQKITEAMSQLGGFSSILIMLGFLFVKFHNEINLTGKIMNQLYSFQNINEKNEKTIKKRGKRKRMNSSFKQPSKGNSLKSIEGVSINENKAIKKLVLELPALESLNKFEKKEILRGPDIKPKILSDDSVKCEGSVRTKKDFEVEEKKKSDLNNDAKIKTENIHSPFVRSVTKYATNLFKKKHKTLEKFSISSFTHYVDSVGKEQNFSMSFFQVLKARICKFFHFKMSPRDKLLSQAQKIFKEELDLTTILRKLQDVEKMKIILLNEQQLCLFNLLAKPMIYVDSKQDSAGLSMFNLLNTKKNSENMLFMKKTLKVYQDLQRSEAISEIDKRLLKLVDKNLKEFCLHLESKEMI